VSNKTILCVSDFHLEFHEDPIGFLKNNIFEEIRHANAEFPNYLMIAGDLVGSICSDEQSSNGERLLFKEAVKVLSESFEHVLYTAGNHEHYFSKSFEQVDEFIRETSANYPNFHYLQDEVLVLDGQRFIGMTLWHKGERHPEFEQIKHRMSDFQCIPYGVYDRNFNSIAFLKNNLQEGDIVFTHHLPTFDCVTDKWKPSLLNPFFVNHDLEELIIERKPRLWHYGHSHEFNPEFKVGNTSMITNPKGYVTFERDNMRRDLIITT